MMPFVTLTRAFPTQVLMMLIVVFLLTVEPLVPIAVAFFIIFPMAYESIHNAVNNVNRKNIEMMRIFNVSK
jgi:ABC-type nitrate/sulfonate/bicarbonate transport system permease component